MKNKQQSGFIQIIILIIIVLVLMKYFGVTISGILDWIASFFDWLASFFRGLLR